MEIQSNYIKEAELILIDGNAFDEEERVPFIKNLETRDLLAVPGSGKTTALQAKLYCLAKQMPFDDSSGILVLSHTNKAVEEIEKKLKEHCPQLFQHPNFIGTVQSFVNGFLTMPYYTNRNRQRIVAIETDYFNFRFRNLALNTFLAIKETKHLFRTPKTDYLYNFDISTDSNGVDCMYDRVNDTIITIAKPKGNTKLENYNDWSSQKKEKIIKNIIDLKKRMFSDGILSYEDSYFYSHRYIQTIPNVKYILQARFKYIFIDEAQDLEKYQLDIIESIFNTEESNCVIQRIGDINQSIYNSGKSIKVQCDWKPRNPMPLNSSLRLTKNIADIVDYFSLEKDFPQTGGESLKFKVDGKGQTEETILPYLIIFDNAAIGLLKPQFEELIRRHNLYDGFDGRNTKKGFKIIGWSGTWGKEEKRNGLRLENIFPNEYKVASESKKSRVNLCEYLICNPLNKSLKKYSDGIMEALCAVLRIAECMNITTRNGLEIKRYFTSQTFWKYLVEQSRKYEGKLSEQDLLDFKSKLYTWSLSIATNEQIEQSYNEIKSFVTDELSKWLELSITTEVLTFLGMKYENAVSSDTNPLSDANTEIPIEVCSVHSVKGQTHCATMYVETSYHNYETSKKQVLNAFKRENHSLLTSKNAKRSIEAFKMMYVGFSRPTHLLCFAVHNNNLTDEYRSFFGDQRNGWKLLDLTTKNTEPHGV